MAKREDYGRLLYEALREKADEDAWMDDSYDPDPLWWTGLDGNFNLQRVAERFVEKLGEGEE